MNCIKDFDFTINDNTISIFSMRISADSTRKIPKYSDKIWKPITNYLRTDENSRIVWATLSNKIKHYTEVFLRNALIDDEEMLLHSCVLAVQFVSYAKKIAKNNNNTDSLLEMIVILDKSMVELCNKNGVFEYGCFETSLMQIYYQSFYDTVIEITINQNVNMFNNNNYHNLIEFRKLGCIYEYLKLTEDIIKYNNNNLSFRSYYSTVDFILRVAFLKAINSKKDLNTISNARFETEYGNIIGKNIIKAYLYKPVNNNNNTVIDNENNVYELVINELQKNLLNM